MSRKKYYSTIFFQFFLFWHQSESRWRDEVCTQPLIMNEQCGVLFQISIPVSRGNVVQNVVPKDRPAHIDKIFTSVASMRAGTKQDGRPARAARVT
jgi:hypothetical protein